MKLADVQWQEPITDAFQATIKGKGLVIYIDRNGRGVGRIYDVLVCDDAGAVIYTTEGKGSLLAAEVQALLDLYLGG